jgi:hypothetical protein
MSTVIHLVSILSKDEEVLLARLEEYREHEGVVRIIHQVFVDYTRIFVPVVSTYDRLPLVTELLLVAFYDLMSNRQLNTLFKNVECQFTYRLAVLLGLSFMCVHLLT